MAHRAEQLPEQKTSLRPTLGLPTNRTIATEDAVRRSMIGGLSRVSWVPKRALPGHAATVDNVVRVGDSFCRAVMAFVSRKSNNKTKVGATSVSGQAQRLGLFGPPLL